MDEEAQEFKQQLGQIVSYARENASNLSVEAKAKFAQFLKAAATKLSDLKSKKQVDVYQEEIPDTARLLWVASGGDPRVFAQFLETYPDPQLDFLRRDPRLLVDVIKRLSQEIPKGRPSIAGGIPESWLPSSNVWGFKYDPYNKQMFVKFNGKDVKSSGPTYVYHNVPPQIAQIVEHGAVSAKTTGSNKWSSWWTSKNPSIGASVSALLVRGGFPYQRLQ